MTTKCIKVIIIIIIIIIPLSSLHISFAVSFHTLQSLYNPPTQLPLVPAAGRFMAVLLLLCKSSYTLSEMSYFYDTEILKIFSIPN